MRPPKGHSRTSCRRLSGELADSWLEIAEVREAVDCIRGKMADYWLINAVYVWKQMCLPSRRSFSAGSGSAWRSGAETLTLPSLGLNLPSVPSSVLRSLTPCCSVAMFVLVHILCFCAAFTSSAQSDCLQKAIGNSLKRCKQWYNLTAQDKSYNHYKEKDGTL